MLHSDSATLEREAERLTRALRAELGAAMPAQVWLGLAFDAGARAARARIARGDVRGALEALRAERIRAANAANAIGAPTIMLDPEAAWKVGGPGFNSGAALEALADYRAACPGARIAVTSYDCPGYHSGFPWRAWDECDAWFPQVYAAPAEGAPGARSRAGLQRLALHKRQWAGAVERQLLKPRPPMVYAQAHHVTAQQTLCVANSASECALWAFPRRADSEGLLAGRALAELERRGYSGPGRVEAFQRAAGLDVDGLAGRETMRALLG